MAVMLLLSLTMYVVEVSKINNPAKQMTIMSKSETIQMLKDVGIEPSKIVILENGEMAKTEGEFWPIIVALLVGFGSNVANAPSHNDRVYNGPIGSPSTWW